MLTGAEIVKRISEKKLVIEPFDLSRVNPNSYNLALAPRLLEYDMDSCTYLDSKRDNPTKEIIIGRNGYTLLPGHLYLGSTIEYTETPDLIPCISGRSSIARLGIEIHRTAGFGDIGFKGTWTLEITVSIPVKVYAGQQICQISYEFPDGEIKDEYRYKGRYLYQKTATPSRLFLDQR